VTRKFFSLLLAPFAAVSLVACGGGSSSSIPTLPAAPTRTPTPLPSGPITLANPTVTADGLQYIDTVVGTGAAPTIDQQVTVNYTGKLAANGLVFDSTVGKAPATFAIKGVIPGFAEAVMGMKVGGKRTVYIPSALGYGPSGTVGGPIPPNADLVFDIELVSVK
jgi:FKBP-type peptidyl-prolyl cis-trans isomerase